MDDNGKQSDAVSTIDHAVNRFLADLESEAVKLSVADVQRLLELRKQLAQDEVREVRVRWVESSPAPFVTKT